MTDGNYDVLSVAVEHAQLLGLTPVNSASGSSMSIRCCGVGGCGLTASSGRLCSRADRADRAPGVAESRLGRCRGDESRKRPCSVSRPHRTPGRAATSMPGLLTPGGERCELVPAVLGALGASCRCAPGMSRSARSLTDADSEIGCRLDSTRCMGIDLVNCDAIGKMVEVYIGKCPDRITGIHGEDPVALYGELCSVVEDVINHFANEGRPLPTPRVRPMREVA